jgi:hypothetical protein
MTDAPAAIKATFSDFRIVKGRKVCQFVFETPLEAADDALRVLGGLPQPMAERWAAIALLDPKATQEAPQAPEKVKRSFGELPMAQRSALLCDRGAFGKFLNEQYSYSCGFPDETAEALRELCGVKSRSELATNAAAAEKFERLEREFALWLDAPV